MRIGIIAGEASGDQLGAALIQAIRERRPDAVFEGVAGPRMLAAGARTLYPLERLAVMGVFEVLGHLPGLLRMRRGLLAHFRAHPPDVFIGIDAPDFNLGLEQDLRRSGIPTVHYVSPSVWAWRRYRIRRIRRSVDLMLTLFPFETAIYREQGIPVKCVGHPLADLLPMESHSDTARQALGLPVSAPLVALLPGSRAGEWRYLLRPFLETARWCAGRHADLEYVIPLVSAAARRVIEQGLRDWGAGLRVHLVDGKAHEAMAAADAVLMCSGTASLEALLLKRPMVVAYRLSTLTYHVVRPLIELDNFSLPNLLWGSPLVPEFMQDQVTAERLGPALLALLTEHRRVEEMRLAFTQIHRRLRRGAGAAAAEAILELAGG